MALIVSQSAKRAQRLLAFTFAVALAAEPVLAEAQENPAAPTAPASTQTEPAAPVAAGEQTPPAQNLFTREELEKLLAPIALYPDPLLAQLLPASAYPVQIVQVQRWLDKNQALVANNDYSGIDGQNWDPAVKALARFPEVIKKMSDDLDWTTDLGDAEVNQPQDVAEVIQALRAKAEGAGTLKTTTQQTVTTTQQAVTTGGGGTSQASYIEIQPTDPSTVYVPSYDPVAVYQPYTGIAPLLGFGAGIAVGALWNNNYWNWGTGAIYPPVWAGYGGWRPPYAGWRPGQSVCPGGRCGNINNVNIGNKTGRTTRCTARGCATPTRMSRRNLAVAATTLPAAGKTVSTSAAEAATKFYSRVAAAIAPTSAAGPAAIAPASAISRVAATARAVIGPAPAIAPAAAIGPVPAIAPATGPGPAIGRLPVLAPAAAGPAATPSAMSVQGG